MAVVGGCISNKVQGENGVAYPMSGMAIVGGCKAQRECRPPDQYRPSKMALMHSWAAMAAEGGR